MAKSKLFSRLNPTKLIAIFAWVLVGMSALTFAEMALYDPSSQQDSSSPQTENQNRRWYYSLEEDGIEDGNSLIITADNTEMRVKLCGINAPDLEEPLGIEAKEHLQILASQGRGRLIVISPSQPTPDQVAAVEVIVPLEQDNDEIHLNSRMLADGMARLKPEEIGSCAYKNQSTVAENLAKENETGLWAAPSVQ